MCQSESCWIMSNYNAKKDFFMLRFCCVFFLRPPELLIRPMISWVISWYLNCTWCHIFLAEKFKIHKWKNDITCDVMMYKYDISPSSQVPARILWHQTDSHPIMPHLYNYPVFRIWIHLQRSEFFQKFHRIFLTKNSIFYFPAKIKI